MTASSDFKIAQNSYFADFEKVKKLEVILLTLKQSKN